MDNWSNKIKNRCYTISKEYNIQIYSFSENYIKFGDYNDTDVDGYCNVLDTELTSDGYFEYNGTKIKFIENFIE
jgi:hypothetical protein